MNIGPMLSIAMERVYRHASHHDSRGWHAATIKMKVFVILKIFYGTIWGIDGRANYLPVLANFFSMRENRTDTRDHVAREEHRANADNHRSCVCL